MNSVEICSTNNTAEISVFDVYTTTYFLTAAATIEEHSPAKKGEAEPNGL